MHNLLLDSRVYHAGKLGTEHSCGNSEVAADMIRVYVRNKILVGRLVGVVVVDDDNREVVNLCDLIGGLVLLGRSVVHHQNEREFLTESDVVAECEVQIACYVLNLVERRLRGSTFEEVVLGIHVPAFVADKGKDSLFDRYCRHDSVGIGMVTENYRLIGKDCLSYNLGNLLHLGL